MSGISKGVNHHVGAMGLLGWANKRLRTMKDPPLETPTLADQISGNFQLLSNVDKAVLTSRLHYSDVLRPTGGNDFGHWR
jgi:hypothetical protein